MSVFQALILGIVQGLTEFLPISSSAHLVLVPEALGWEQPSLPYLVMLHTATLLALLIYFRRELLQLARGIFHPGPERKLVALLALATLPAAAIGVLFEEQLTDSFGKPVQVAIQLVITGVLLVIAEVLARRKGADREVDLGTAAMAQEVTWRSALLIGFSQALAIIPGISRSGATIAAGLVAGMSRPLAAKFSFLLSVPILLGTSIFEVPNLSANGPGTAALVVGFLASSVTGYLSIAGMIAFLQRRGLMPFAAYCIIVGVAAAIFL